MPLPRQSIGDVDSRQELRFRGPENMVLLANPEIPNVGLAVRLWTGSTRIYTGFPHTWGNDHSMALLELKEGASPPARGNRVQLHRA